mgnify:CR=1 FL=1
MVKDGVAVIDVGINRIDDSTKAKGYRIVGDVAVSYTHLTLPTSDLV